MSINKRTVEISIKRPALPPFHSERMGECEDAIADVIATLMDEAEISGWTIAEICMALTNLADEAILNEVDIEQTNFLMRELTAKR